MAVKARERTAGMADLTPCPFDNRNCMCQFCEKQCNNGLNCSGCKYSGKVEHSIYLCTGFAGDLDAYMKNQYRR